MERKEGKKKDGTPGNIKKGMWKEGGDRGKVYLQHFVWGSLDAWGHVGGAEGQLLHFGKVVPRVSVEHQLAHRDQRKVCV